MKNSPSVGELGGIIARFMRRYHVMLFTLTVVISVSVAVFMLNGIITLSNETDDSIGGVSGFDTATIERIENFNMSNDISDDFSLPPGRVNPFIE